MHCLTSFLLQCLRSMITMRLHFAHQHQRPMSNASLICSSDKGIEAVAVVIEIQPRRLMDRVPRNLIFSRLSGCPILRITRQPFEVIKTVQQPTRFSAQSQVYCNSCTQVRLFCPVERQPEHSPKIWVQSMGGIGKSSVWSDSRVLCSQQIPCFHRA